MTHERPGCICARDGGGFVWESVGARGRRGCYDALEELHLVGGSFHISRSRFHNLERDVAVQPVNVIAIWNRQLSGPHPTHEVNTYFWSFASH